MRKLGKRMSIVAFDMSVKGQSFILLLDTNNATTLLFVVGNEQRFKNRCSNIFQFRPYNRFLCSQSLHFFKNNNNTNKSYSTRQYTVI